jgi:hypothetical protein
VKILCVHGAGHVEVRSAWQTAWRHAIAHGIHTAYQDTPLDADHDIQFTAYDDLLEPVVNHLTPADIARAAILLGGGLVHRALTLPDIADEARWTAGLVIAWAENAALRDLVRQRFLADVERLNPDLICAHSLGSLISYDGFRCREDLITGRTFLTFGSQLGNAFVRGQFGGKMGPFASAAFWYHLYNPHDHVFTAPLNFLPFTAADNFQQVLTLFGSAFPWPLNHDAVSPDPNAPDQGYLTHSETCKVVWPRIAVPAAAIRSRTL